MDIYEGIHSEVVSSNRLDENSDISTTYLGRVNKEMQKYTKSREIISYFRTWLHLRQIIRWHRMSVTTGHRCK